MDTKVIVITIICKPDEHPAICAMTTDQLEYHVREGGLNLGSMYEVEDDYIRGKDMNVSVVEVK